MPGYIFFQLIKVFFSFNEPTDQQTNQELRKNRPKPAIGFFHWTDCLSTKNRLCYRLVDFSPGKFGRFPVAKAKNDRLDLWKNPTASFSSVRRSVRLLGRLSYALTLVLCDSSQGMVV